MHHVELTPRLHTVASLVPKGARLADIGTDHAYLPAWLLQQGQISSAVAADIHAGPLERAQQTAQRYGLTEKISFRLCDGLVGIDSEEADAIAIAGMGGETIAMILSAAPWLLEEKHRLILQPMSGQDELRRWLWVNGYTISRELLSQEEEKLYVVMEVVAGKTAQPTPAELWVGKQERGQVAPLRSLYLTGIIARLERAINGLSKSTKVSDVPRLQGLKEAVDGLYKMKEEWESWQQ